jgi:short-subunit dehydrogenase
MPAQALLRQQDITYVLLARRLDRLESIKNNLESQFKIQVHAFEIDVGNRNFFETLVEKTSI